MNKKISIALGILLSIIFAFSVCFANDGLQKAADDVRNVVGGVENTVENAAKDVSNVSKDMTSDVENTASEGMQDIKDTTTGTMTDRNNGNYTATRTSTDETAGGTLMGMNSTAWIWLIMGIAAIAIIAIVWYYSMQFTNNHNNDRLD